ncbi:hypothetical protein CLE01_24350 [Cryobacterium levicorallinum]|uniref:Uncharacterized protein n=1 Tax=Cryobacterium levicorallinum TaxID=995038 RepID=A0ABY1EGK6_9MICO|nr:hypothetical protein CLE01_24350 [Cryobacterium levicorallinum]SFH76763.1 hypothetical protein SAMN05216274_11462 [Cryobacterium levicorallinum]
MTHEITAPMTATELPAQLDRDTTTSAGTDFRRRQLAIFRERQHEAEPEPAESR